MHNYLDFEKGLAEIEGKAEELRALARQDPKMKIESEAKALDAKATEMLKELYAELSPWRKCQVARHPDPLLAREDVELLGLDHVVADLGLGDLRKERLDVVGVLEAHVDDAGVAPRDVADRFDCGEPRVPGRENR